MTAMTRKTDAVVPASANGPGLTERYKTLLEGPDTTSAAWLSEQLSRAQHLPDDLPADPAQLDAWSARHAS